MLRHRQRLKLQYKHHIKRNVNYAVNIVLHKEMQCYILFLVVKQMGETGRL